MPHFSKKKYRVLYDRLCYEFGADNVVDNVPMFPKNTGVNSITYSYLCFNSDFYIKNLKLYICIITFSEYSKYNNEICNTFSYLEDLLRSKYEDYLIFYEDEVYNKLDIIISYMYSLTNSFKSIIHYKDINKNNFYIDTVKKRDAIEFLSNNDIYNPIYPKGKCANSLGVYYNNELILLAIFKYTARKSGIKHEVIRKCNKLYLGYDFNITKLIFDYYIYNVVRNPNISINYFLSYRTSFESSLNIYFSACEPTTWREEYGSYKPSSQIYVNTEDVVIDGNTYPKFSIRIKKSQIKDINSNFAPIYNIDTSSYIYNIETYDSIVYGEY